MKKFILLTIVFLFIISCNIQAQNLIAVQHGDIALFYSNLQSAIENAQNGDTIYVSGGTYNESVEINKRVHLIGAGHNPDSSQATVFTKITGTLIFHSNANYGSVCGLYTYGLYFDNVSNFMTNRCFTSVINFANCEQLIFTENVISYIQPSGNPSANTCLFLNNIFTAPSSLETCTNSIFKNNIFLSNAWCAWGDCSFPIRTINSILENNIFLSDGTWAWIYTCNGSVFNNNLFVESVEFPVNGGIYGCGNIINQPQSSIFINQSQNSFDYSHDYHLQPTCPGKNAGTDGTDIGIYGGSHPWKEGSVPPNPHIKFQSISGGTDQNGNLNVNIKVSAQDH